MVFYKPLMMLLVEKEMSKRLRMLLAGISLKAGSMEFMAKDRKKNESGRKYRERNP